jgi:hypothetical protein
VAATRRIVSVDSCRKICSGTMDGVARSVSVRVMCIVATGVAGVGQVADANCVD